MTTNERPRASSLRGNFQAFVLCSVVAWALAGCGDDANTPQAPCPNPDTPLVLTLKDVFPEPGSTVPNQEIVHTFTVVEATGTFSTLSFGQGNDHTADAPSPEELVFSSEATGGDVVYTFEPVVWTKAGHVELVELGEYSDSHTCFILPRPIFSYDVVAP